jgi:hypothetical protein
LQDFSGRPKACQLSAISLQPRGLWRGRRLQAHQRA